MGGYGMGGYGGGMGGYGMGGYGMGGGYSALGFGQPTAAVATTTTTGTTTGTGTGDLTGSYLGAERGIGMGFGMNFHPRIIPNPFDNTLLIQATPAEWDAISQLIEKIDISPRQVLIEAKVYEVELTGAFALGVQSFLQKRTTTGTAPGIGGTASRFFAALTNASGSVLTAGTLVGSTRELLGLLTAQESNTKVKVISAPSVIATDSIPASINVGQDVPTLSSQAVSGAQVAGTSQFANTISSRSTGVGLNILARVNASGIVTMVINQQVSSPQAPAAGGIQSPSFQQRTVQTQVTVQDGDTVSIGGII
jgi:general secretion pathway protein D